MPTYKVQSVIPTVDNVVANYATNSWHVLADDETALNLFLDELEAFYTTWSPNLSSFVRQTNWELKAYDLADPTPRYPVEERQWSLASAPSGAPLPPEVALVLSFQSGRVSGIPQARRRNRVYLPFLDASVNGTDGRPNSSVISAVITAADDLLTASTAAATWTWIVYSPTSQQADTVLDGWVDNEWDTQRRRGRQSTSRTVFP